MSSLNGRDTTRAKDAQGTPSQGNISPSLLAYEDKRLRMVNRHETCWIDAEASTQAGELIEPVRSGNRNPDLVLAILRNFPGVVSRCCVLTFCGR